MSRVSIAVAPISDYDVINRLYMAWGYRGGIARADVVYVATVDGRAVGVVRRTSEEGVLMLRGMQVDPNVQRQGIGTQLLRALVDDLPPAECYCIPFDHLIGFYRQGGFNTLDQSEGPAFLARRIREYRAQGRTVVLMHRPGR